MLTVSQDFGLARVVGTAGFTRAAASGGGTAAYMSPELSGGRALDRGGESADVFALAVLLAELLTGVEPFADARNEVEIALRVREGERPALPKDLPNELRRLILSCWSSDSIARPDARDVRDDLIDLS